jgi:hypothetical protein
MSIEINVFVDEKAANTQAALHRKKGKKVSQHSAAVVNVFDHRADPTKPRSVIAIAGKTGHVVIAIEDE